MLTCGHDRNGNWIASGTERLVLPRWTGGVGGMDLVESPDRRHVAWFIYSGQSSQGYELIALDPLRRVGGLREVRGHGSAPVFSPSGRWLVSLVDQAARVRGTGEYFEDAQDEYADDRVLADWARLYVHRVPDAAPIEVAVGVDLPRSTELDVVQEWRPYDLVRFTSDDAIVIALPWGPEISLTLPPAGPLTARYDATG